MLILSKQSALHYYLCDIINLMPIGYYKSDVSSTIDNRWLWKVITLLRFFKELMKTALMSYSNAIHVVT